jgi:HEAT repeat protein/type 1 glutamine amidotransferase
MMRNAWLLLAALVASGDVWAAEAQLRVLILSGENNHDWRQTTPKLKSILTASGRFAVDVTEHPEQCDAQTFSRYDALLSNWNAFGNPGATNWPEATRGALLDFVRNGKGFIVVHAGGSSFYDWREYQQLAGAWWKMGQTSHASPHEFTVKPLRDHPITRGMKPFKTTDELWVQPGVSSLSRALAIGDDQPLAFALEFGSGRGFTLLLGHSTAFMDTPGFQSLLLRGAEWAATGNVTLPADTTANEANADTVLKALAAYRFGDSRKPVLDLEKLVAAASLDTTARGVLAGKLTGLLSSEATVEARQVACRQLSLIGSGAEAPPLARLLGDRELGYFARLALERIPAPEAEAALLTALETTTGEVRVGIINSLAARRSPEAVPELSRLAGDSDAATAGACLDALGRIGGDQASAALLAAERKIPAPLKPRLSVALLICAEGMVVSGQTQQASAILEKLTGPEQLTFIRMAAFAARVKALGEKGSEMVIAALSGDDEVLQKAAIRALRSTAQPASLASAVAERLERLPASSQVQAIVWLGECRDPAAQPTLIKAASSSVPAVRQAALTALGLAGNASAIRALTGIAAEGSDEDKRLVAESLMRLRGSDVDSAMIAALKVAPPAEQRELIRALELRQTKAAVPALFELAGGEEAASRHSAIAAVGKLGDAAACAGLAKLMQAHPQDAVSAMAEICRREATVEPMLTALANVAPPGKAALLEALGSMGGAQALVAVRAELKADDTELRVAAVRALANWPDAAPLDDLAALASTATDARTKALALRGVAHLAPLAKDRPREAVNIITAAMKAGGAPSEQKALLAALGEIPDAAALNALQASLSNPALASEAKAAMDQIQERRAKVTALPWDDQAIALFNSPENLCRGATATNLDNLTPDGQGQGPFAALDGNPETYWDETDNQPLYWLRVQLKQPATVACLRILGFQHHNYAPKDFEVLGDGKLIKKVENAVYERNLLTVDLPPTECRTIELKITGYYGQSPAIRELGLFGKPGTAK